tara:strand:+ start:8304 stop:9398 length:1095 start_codon:yes stop_codon:yes gene_type:complete
MPNTTSNLSTTTADYTNLLSQTWGALWRQRISLIVDQSPLLHMLFSKGAVHFEAAPWAARPFTHATNPNIQVYEGAQVLNAATFQHTKMFRYIHWGQMSCQSVVPTDDVDKNENAKNKIASLLETEQYIAAETMRQFIEEQLHTAWASNGDMEGLADFIEFALPAAQAATVGEIAKSVPLNHFNQYNQIAGGFMTNGVPALKKLYRQCSRYGRHPDLLLVDSDVYDGYEEWLGPMQRLQDEAMANVGYENVMFKGAVMCPDYNITEGSGQIYMLNITGKRPSQDVGFNFDPGMLDPVKGKTRGPVDQGNLQLWINPNAFFTPSPWREGEDQHVLKSKTRFHAMLTISNLREQGCSDFAGGVYSA